MITVITILSSPAAMVLCSELYTAIPSWNDAAILPWYFAQHKLCHNMLPCHAVLLPWHDAAMLQWYYARHNMLSKNGVQKIMLKIDLFDIEVSKWYE